MTTGTRADATSPLSSETSNGSRAGVGYSESTDSRQAGIDAARTAVSGLGGRAPSLVFLFATSRIDPHAMHEGVRSVVGPDVQLVGGSTFGGITNDWLGYDGFQTIVAAIASDTMRVDLFADGPLNTAGEFAIGASLGRKIASHRFEGEPSLLLMYDSVKKAGAELNVATTILDGMASELEWPATVAGVGQIGDLQFRPTYQFLGDAVAQQTAIAAMFSGGVRMDAIIMHGCKPSGRYHTITKSDGPVLFEIDGRPVLDVMAEILPERTYEEFPLFLTLGVNRGDKFGEFREEDYANHLCMAIDKERGALVMFEPNLTPGSEVQLMRRVIDQSYLGQRVDELFARVGSRRAFFALYIDCAGRAAGICNTETEEAIEVQRALTARGVPLLGTYSGVEIAKVAGRVEALDWTGVLCVFSE